MWEDLVATELLEPMDPTSSFIWLITVISIASVNT